VGYLRNISATTNPAGEWAGLLPTMPASQPGVSYSLTASLDKVPHLQQRLSNVVFGDVFVCGGQSNMELPVSLVNNNSLELADATAFPWIHVAVVNSASSNTPLRDTPAPLLLPWQHASPTALGSNNSHSWSYFSATCWLTARNVAEMLGPSVPLGLVGSYVGGTPVESWTPGLNPADKDPQGHKFAVLYNAMIAPLTGMTIRAILFYQGENNSFRSGEPERWIKYATDFPLMIKRWREAWATNTGQSALSDTPFGFVQIGPRDCIPDADHQGSTSTFYGGVRWSQTAFQYNVPNEKMRNTFMAVAADLAEGYSPVLDLEAGCVHFGDKQDVGRRLALGVAKHVYGRNVVDTGPMVVQVEEAQTAPTLLKLHFTTSERIEVRNASGFELSTNGKDYHGATITAHDSSSVTLAAPRGMTGTVVSLRYILHDTPCINKTCAVYGSKSGLPSPPLVANLPGHAGADQVGWNMTKEANGRQK
jgi:sialate O-acetylesterase